MRTQKIQRMINQAIEDEKRTGRLADIFWAMAKSNGKLPSQADIDGLVLFVQQYVQHVPHYMEQGLIVAQQVGLGTEMNLMAGQLEAYWLEKNDFIPDNLGLVGIMDDAYASMLLLQSVSDYCQATAGKPLLEPGHNVTQANQLIRGLIGEPMASQLDSQVGVTITQTLMKKIIGQFSGAAGFNFGGGSDPIWGNASIEEIANVRLGAMGVI